MTEFKSNTRISKLIESFDIDRKVTIDNVYKSYRSEFLSFMNSISRDKELNIDCYQDAVVSLYENLCNNKITSDSSTVKTYLFAIGKNKILNAIKRKSNLVLDENIKLTELPNEDLNDSLYQALSVAISNLGGKCKEILKKFYYDNYSIDAIMHDMGYKNENTVKAHKSRCLNQLRSVFNQSTTK